MAWISDIERQLSDKNILRRIAIVLYIISIFLFTYYIVTANLVITDYGLVQSLTPEFYISAELLIISFIILVEANERTLLFPVELLTFYVYFNILQFILEKTPRFTFSYLTYGHTDYIIRFFHTNTDLFTYQNWPGLMFLGAELHDVSLATGVTIIALYMIIIKLLILLTLYLMLRTFLKSEVLPWIGLLFFLAGDWTAQYYFTPPSLGIYFYFLIILIFVMLIFNVIKLNLSWGIIICVLSASLVISHMLMSIVLIINILILLLLSRYSNLFKLNVSIRDNLFKCLAIVGVMFAAWIVYPVESYFSGNLAKFLDDMFNPFSIMSQTNSMVSAGPVHSNVMQYKIGFTLIYFTLGGLAILLFIIYNKKKLFDINSLPLLIIISNAIITPLLIGSYNGEILSRVFMITSPFIIYFIAKSWNNKVFKITIIIMLLMTPYLYYISAYGNEKADYIANYEIIGVNFYYDHIDKPIYSLYSRIWEYRDMEQMLWHPLVTNKEFNINWGSIINNDGYIVIDDREIDAINFNYGHITKDNILTWMGNSFSKVYTSGSFDLYH